MQKTKIVSENGVIIGKRKESMHAPNAGLNGNADINTTMRGIDYEKR